MDTDILRFERVGGVGIATFNQPARLNPLSIGLQQALRALLARLGEERDLGCLLLTGAGKAFCVGADLGSMRAAPDETQSLGERTAGLMQELTNPLVLDLRALPMPVLAAVNGPCAGAGVGLALAADIVLMGSSAYFYLPFLPKLGIVPDAGSTWFLERFVGSSRALAHALTGDRIDADSAVRQGLAYAAHDDAVLMDEALKLARRLARLPAHAALEARRAFDAARRHTLAEQLAYEAQRQRELIDRPEFAEGVKAFGEKREPDFGRGR
ncbi:enoyl-CoA hydratase/isomerase family protein [Pelomonas sp. KK5]|uniref:enoyl-CoA hydratase/isomerase family protein n=1 Tax=Pelomonas sp. KK5 TaxID=1855730 RepID=UPI00117D76FB|nr:enoyl-CoA hydratase-related protein [Pelomonas sp. KK5]